MSRHASTTLVDLTAGTRLEQVTLIRPLAQGGMGAVWLARLDMIDKLVAIKLILPEHAADTEFRAMLVDEARLAAKLSHPNVAQVHDLRVSNDLLYLVMEWVDGPSLTALVRLSRQRGAQLPPALAARIGSGLCNGLHAMHELRDEDGRSLETVHRDVSPQNVLLAPNGAAKVIDFGVATWRGRAMRQTMQGIIKGKVRYMAPEQLRGEPLDRRADVWALGAVLHVLFSGRPPYEQQGEEACIQAILSATPPPPLPAHVPAGIAEVVRRALAFDRHDRYPTAAAVGEALDLAASREGLVARDEDVARWLSDVRRPTSRPRSLRPAPAAVKSTPRALGRARVEDRIRVAMSRLGGVRECISCGASGAWNEALCTGCLTWSEGESLVIPSPASRENLARLVGDRLARLAVLGSRPLFRVPAAMAPPVLARLARAGVDASARAIPRFTRETTLLLVATCTSSAAAAALVNPVVAASGAVTCGALLAGVLVGSRRPLLPERSVSDALPADAERALAAAFWSLAPGELRSMLAAIALIGRRTGSRSPEWRDGAGTLVAQAALAMVSPLASSRHAERIAALGAALDTLDALDRGARGPSAEVAAGRVVNVTQRLRTLVL